LTGPTSRGFQPRTCALDKGYDAAPVYDALGERGCVPVIPLKRVLSKQTKPSRDDTSHCDHGTWTFAGADFKRRAAKWRCPTGECEPKSRWVKGSRRNPLIPRDSKRWGGLYRGRAAVERMMLAWLSRLTQARAVPLAA
jgi:DDE family transposase